MARFQNVRTASCVGLATALLIGASSLFAAEETSKSSAKKSSANDAGAAAESSKSKSPKDSKSKKWKSEGAAASKSYATHRPRPFVDLKNSAAVAASVDRMILENLAETGTDPGAAHFG